MDRRPSNRNAWILALAVIGSIGVVAIWYPSASFLTQPDRPLDLDPTTHAVALPSPTPLVAARANSAGGVTSPTRGVAARNAAWADFQQRFGPRIEAVFLPDGTLASIRGAAGNAPSPDPTFDPRSSAGAIARAEEVLAAARELLGVRPEFPLGQARAQGGPSSAQVFYKEMHGETPIAPMGNVTVDLGPRGELLGLSSDYVTDITIANARQLDETQASRFAGPDSGAASQVIWVRRPGASAPSNASAPSEGRHAYEYSVNGTQVIVDAADGKILFRRDRRRF